MDKGTDTIEEHPAEEYILDEITSGARVTAFPVDALQAIIEKVIPERIREIEQRHIYLEEAQKRILDVIRDPREDGPKQAFPDNEVTWASPTSHRDGTIAR